MGMTAHASSNVESVVLNDGTVVAGNEISDAHFVPFSNQIDFLELTEGSKIESSDIKTVNFKKLFPNKFQNSFNQVRAAVRVGGDGSGG